MSREINKLLKHLSAARLKKNDKECIELCNMLGGLYAENGCYDEAANYHEKALETATKIGDILATAVAHRLIGESKASISNFRVAFKHINKYLDLAIASNDRTEIQRAYTTMGRVYLMKAQELRDETQVLTDETKSVALKAEQYFLKAQKLAYELRDNLTKVEFAQMLSGLLLNLGLIKDICGEYIESVKKLHEAIKVCNEAKLKEDLFRIQLVSASIHRQKKNFQHAVKLSDEALTTARSIGKKITICEALLEKGLIKIYQKDFKAAKRVFAKAYMEKSTNEEDHMKAMRMIKISHCIIRMLEKVTSNNASQEDLLRNFDKLGDLFTELQMYTEAADHYKRALSYAKSLCKSKSDLSKLLYSIAEAYADGGQFRRAMAFYEQELSLRDGNEAEQCATLLKIAKMRQYLDEKEGVDSANIVKTYELAYKKSLCKLNLQIQVLKDYVSFMTKQKINTKRCKELEEILIGLEQDSQFEANNENDDIDESGGGVGEYVGDFLDNEIPNLDDIISDDENDEEINGKLPSSGEQSAHHRQSWRSKKFKTNEMGESPLHEACIKGDLKRVKMLIDNHHELNVRDNFGWTPLHEACNNGYYEIAEYLIEKGADVSDRGPKGVSALHDAAANGHIEIMRLLIKHKANVIALTDKGETVLSCLREYRKEKQNSLANQDLYECVQMENELLNIMDRSGFNLVEDNIKKFVASVNNNSGGKQSAQDAAFVEMIPNIKPPSSSSGSGSGTVKGATSEYKQVMKTLKRRKHVEFKEKKVCLSDSASQVLVKTSESTSVPTKSWFKLDSDDDDDVECYDNDVKKSTHDIAKIQPADCSGKASAVVNKRTEILIESDDDDDEGDDRTNNARVTAKHDKHNPAAIVDDDDDDDYGDQVIVDDKFAQSTTVDSRRNVQGTVADYNDGNYNQCHYNEEFLNASAVDREDYKDDDTNLMSTTELDEPKSDKLELRFVNVPRALVDDFLADICGKAGSIVELDMAGSQCFVLNDCSALFRCLSSLSSLRILNLSCCAIRAYHFERLCSELRCHSLQLIDLSYNLIYIVDARKLERHLQRLYHDATRASLTKLILEPSVESVLGLASGSRANCEAHATLDIHALAADFFERQLAASAASAAPTSG